MKTTGAFLFALLLGAPLYAQETLFEGEVDFGGYGGPAVQFTSVNQQLGVLVGGGGGVIIGHMISIGGAGYGLVNDVTEESAPAEKPYLVLGYGGGYLQYIHRSDDLIHFTGSVLIGGGGVSFRKDYETMIEESESTRDTSADAFFVVEPSLEAELNVAKYFRVSLGAGYRFVTGIETPGLKDSDISGPSARIIFKFGSF